MYAIPKTNYLRRSFIVNNLKPNSQRTVISQNDRIRQQLQFLGASHCAINSLEGRYLPHIIHQDENLRGVVYGKSKDGFAMMIATDRRAIYLDKKPLFVNQDDITYDVVSGISHSRAGMGSTIILHTRIKDYKIKTMNLKCANAFVDAIEMRCIDHKEQGA